MTLQQWAEHGWLTPHRADAREIRNLLAIVERDLSDASAPISPDWRFGIACNAALKLCTVLLHASGYRAEKNLQHYRTIQALPLVLGPDRQGDTEYLDACRRKRNTVEYDAVGGATERDAEELTAFVRDLRNTVEVWLRARHPELMAR
jgi:hypothetical protein